MKISTDKKNIKNLTLEELSDEVESFGEKRFRAGQIFNWIYNNRILNIEEMTNLPKRLLEKLKTKYEIFSLVDVTSLSSTSTGTLKYLFKTVDNKLIESVIIPDKEKNTLCISTQVGCPLDCKFCATGLMGYKRNLSTAEIIDQYILAGEKISDGNINNIVYMGMGEPLLNFNSTLNSLRIFTDESIYGISRNRITVSTAGIPHKISELADSGLKVKLALSLHSPFEEIRSRIMPINEKYPIASLKEPLIRYARKTKTKITFEYTMLKGINDREEDITALARLCRQVPAKINIIPFNSIKHMNPEGTSAELKPTSFERIKQFADKLRDNNTTVMVRQTQGDDIAAACGQLAAEN